MMDDVIGQASEVKGNLKSQRATLMNTSNALSTITSRFPAIAGVMDAISSKRNRDNVILSVVIGFCICLTLYLYMS